LTGRPEKKGWKHQRQTWMTLKSSKVLAPDNVTGISVSNFGLLILVFLVCIGFYPSVPGTM
jgi:hypothetical protein